MHVCVCVCVHICVCVRDTERERLARDIKVILSYGKWFGNIGN